MVGKWSHLFFLVFEKYFRSCLSLPPRFLLSLRLSTLSPPPPKVIIGAYAIMADGEEMIWSVLLDFTPPPPFPIFPLPLPPLRPGMGEKRSFSNVIQSQYQTNATIRLFSKILHQQFSARFPLQDYWVAILQNSTLYWINYVSRFWRNFEWNCEGIYFVCEGVHVVAPGSSAFREKLTAWPGTYISL